MIIGGSGRACDQFVRVHDLLKDPSIENEYLQLKDKVLHEWKEEQNKSTQTCSTVEGPNANNPGEKKPCGFLTSGECFDLIYECVKKTRLIRIVPWNDGKRNALDIGLEIFDAIKEASMKSDGGDGQKRSKHEPANLHQQLLKLALDMDRVDLAKRYILEQMAEDDVHVNKSHCSNSVENESFCPFSISYQKKYFLRH